jgi:glycosyltransferase involved in cell wall biosynthesis
MKTNNKIKICHFVNRITGKDDGVFKHLIGQLVYLDKEKFEQFIVFQGGEVVEKYLQSIQIKYYVIEEVEKKFSIKFFLNFLKILIKEKVDIINAHLIKPYVISGLLNIFLRKKLIFSYHGLFIKNDYNSNLEQSIYKISHFLITLFNKVYVLTPSNKSKDILLTETKRFFKIFSYYQGKALFYFNNQSDKQIELELKNLKSEYLIIAFVGRLNREKNAQLCIDIFSRVSESNKNVYLVIFGSGEEEESLKAYVKSSNLERIKFFGYVNNANIYMKYFDILILTSKREGMPIVVWEAMNNSIPVLSTKVGGVEEILTENKCGILFKKKNILDGVVNLLLIIKDKDLRVSLGENGKKAIDTKYSLKNFTNFFENFYNQILNEK